MREFNLEEAKAGKPVCTRDGREARIICFDVENETFPIVAVVKDEDGVENAGVYTRDGYCFPNGDKTADDLMMVSRTRRGWIGIHKSGIGNALARTTHIFSTREEVEEVLREFRVTKVYEIKQIEYEE